MTMNLTAEESASRSMPLEIEPMTSAPTSAVQTAPRPPKRLVPAMTGPGDREQQQFAPAGGLIDGEEPRGGHDAADRRHRPRHREDDDSDLFDPDAGPPRSLDVAADGEDVATEAGLLGEVFHPDHEADQDQQRERHAAVGVEDGDDDDRRRGDQGEAEHERDHALAFEIGGQSPPVPQEGHRAVADDHDRGHDPADRVGVEGVGKAGDLGVGQVDRPGRPEHL